MLLVDALGAPVARRLVLVRHGQTAWNAERRAQGHADVSLDETGRSQAEAMAPVVAAYDPVVLATSDLARARETAALLEKATGLSAREDERLREYDVGARTGLTPEEYADRHGAVMRDAHAHVPADGAESPAEVAARIVPAVQELVGGLEEGQTAVVVTHGACLRILVGGLLGWPLEAADSLSTLPNCGWAVLTESPGSRLRLASYGLTAGG